MCSAVVVMREPSWGCCPDADYGVCTSRLQLFGRLSGLRHVTRVSGVLFVAVSSTFPGGAAGTAKVSPSMFLRLLPLQWLRPRMTLDCTGLPPPFLTGQPGGRGRLRQRPGEEATS
jgi:hypothetical protein